MTPEEIVRVLGVFLGKPNDVNFPGDWNTKIYNVAEHIAQLAHKSRPDREKIDKCVKECPDCGGSGHIPKGYAVSRCLRCQTKRYVIDYDQIIALFPDEEEIRKELESLKEQIVELNKKLDELEGK